MKHMTIAHDGVTLNWQLTPKLPEGHVEVYVAADISYLDAKTLDTIDARLKYLESLNSQIASIYWIGLYDGDTLPPHGALAVTGDVWSFDTTQTLLNSGWPVLKNGKPYAGGRAVLLLSYNGALYALNSSNVWFRANLTAPDGWTKLNGDPRIK